MLNYNWDRSSPKLSTSQMRKMRLRERRQITSKMTGPAWQEASQKNCGNGKREIVDPPHCSAEKKAIKTSYLMSTHSPYLGSQFHFTVATFMPQFQSSVHVRDLMFYKAYASSYLVLYGGTLLDNCYIEMTFCTSHLRMPPSLTKLWRRKVFLSF